MAQVTAIITKIVMDGNYHVSFYDQYGYVVQTLETDTYVEVVDAYLVCGSNGDSIRFFANTVELIEGPTFSQAYTPLPGGFFQQGSQYFERLSAMYDYIKSNVVNVVVRDISALKFRDGTTQTTAATGGGGSGTVTSVGFTAGTGITVGGTNPITTSGSVTITNSAPDQVVTLTDGTGIDVTGTYPSFTITNTAPDQTVVLTEGTGIDITGTYPNFTIASTVSGGIPHGTASGTDTYTTTITGVTAYNDADAYLIRFTTGNTTSATLNINSLGAIPLYRNNDGELIGGDIIDGAEMLCVYNSTTNRFQVIGTAPNTLLAYVTNADTVAIVKGQPVYAFGGQGDRLTVKLASNSSDATSAQTVGLVLSTSIGVNQKGLIILNGQLDGLGSLKPSAGWADGDPVYLGSTPGSITNIKPYAPNHLVYLGFVTTANSGSAGRMYVRVQNGYEMDELHNVQAQNPNLNDTLYYDNTVSPGQWKTASIPTILGYTPANDSNVVHTTGNESISGVKTFSDNQIINTSSASSALRITQTGTGEALRIEDSNNPDSTPVVVTADGLVGIGTATPDSILHVHNATAGTVTPISGSVMTLENNTTCYFTTLAPDANFSGFVMGSPSDAFGAFIRWGHTSGKLEIGTANSGDYIELYVQNAVSKAFVNGNGLGVNVQPVASAAFQVDSTTQGVLVSRMTTTQRNAIASPATGLMVYDTNLNSFYFYNGSTWSAIGGSGSGTVTSIATSAPLTGGTITTSGTIGIDQATTSQNGYLSSTDWNIFNGKQDAITGAATTITTSNLTASRALVSDGSGKVATNAVTSTELGYLSGVTSNVQTQLNSKASVTKSFLFGTWGNATVAANTTVYNGFVTGGHVVAANEFTRITMIPVACNLSDFIIRCNPQIAGNTLTITLRKNGVDTACAIVIAGGSAAGNYSTSTSVAFAAGDFTSIKLANVGASVAGAIIGGSILVSI